MAAPIPLRLLVDTAAVEVPDESSDYAGTYAERRTIRHVRLDAATVSRSDQWHGDAPQSGATLFVDAACSQPAAPPAVGDRVTVSRGGTEVYRGMVTAVRACLDESGIHHWEVTLS